MAPKKNLTSNAGNASSSRTKASMATNSSPTPKKKQKAGLSSEISQSAANFESEDENVELDEQGNEESSRRGNRILIHYFLKLKTFFFISCGGKKQKSKSEIYYLFSHFF